MARLHLRDQVPEDAALDPSRKELLVKLLKVVVAAEKVGAERSAQAFLLPAPGERLPERQETSVLLPAPRARCGAEGLGADFPVKVVLNGACVCVRGTVFIARGARAWLGSEGGAECYIVR